MATDPKIKVTINAETTTEPQLQEVKLQGVLLAEITIETTTIQLLELYKVEYPWPSYWFDSSGQRVEDFNLSKTNPEDLPLQLWHFITKRDIERKLEDALSLED